MPLPARNSRLSVTTLVVLAVVLAESPVMTQTSVFHAGTQPDTPALAIGGAGAELNPSPTLLPPSPSGSLVVSSAPASLPVPPVGGISVRAARSASRPLSAAAPISGASAAVAYALRQIGKPYRFGAAGESAFDCSGLVMRAWQQGGVSLPHKASAMAGSGRRVSRTELRPGDLVILYNYGHVQLYVGGGQVVEAAKPGTVVRISKLSSQVDALVRVGE